MKRLALVGLFAALATFAAISSFGFSNVGKLFDNFPNAPTRSGYFVDFNTDEDANQFVSTTAASGTFSVLDTLQHGFGRISGAATTDNSGSELQYDAANVALATSKHTRFTARLKVSDATQSDLVVGLAVLDTSLFASAPSSAIWFRKDDDDAYLDAVIRSGSSEVASSTGVYTLADDTTVTLSIDVAMTSTSNKGTVTFYVNGTSVATITNSSLPSSIMAGTVAFISGNASGTKTCDIDYIGVDQDR